MIRFVLNPGAPGGSPAYTWNAQEQQRGKPLLILNIAASYAGKPPAPGLPTGIRIVHTGP